MNKFIFVCLFLSLYLTNVSSQANQISSNEILKRVRLSYNISPKNIKSELQQGFTKRVPFLLSLKKNSIGFIFSDPDQIIRIDTSGDNFNLYEGIYGKKEKKISKNKYNLKIRDTDITYNDISMSFLYWPTSKIINNEEIFKKRLCWKIRIINPNNNEEYKTVDVWIQKNTGAMLKSVAYNDKGRAVKRFNVLEGKKFGDSWMAGRVRIETIDNNMRVKSYTNMVLKSEIQ